MPLWFTWTAIIVQPFTTDVATGMARLTVKLSDASTGVSTQYHNKCPLEITRALPAGDQADVPLMLPNDRSNHLVSVPGNRPRTTPSPFAGELPVGAAQWAALIGMGQERAPPFHAEVAFVMDTALPDAFNIGEVLQRRDLLVSQRIAG